MSEVYQRTSEKRAPADKNSPSVRPVKKPSRTRRKVPKGTNPPSKRPKRHQQALLRFPEPFLPGFGPPTGTDRTSAGMTNSPQSASFLNLPFLRFLVAA